MSCKVINNRNKANLEAEDGTVIEVSFDDLEIKDARENNYEMRNEIEAEVLSGNPENLKDIYRIINESYDVQRNDASKYSRAVREMNEQRNNMSLEEITLCAMLSDILQTLEFQQLRYKGQMIHDYRKEIPDNLNLDHFKDPRYLIDKISEVKRTKNYKVGKIKNLEDMFLCFFSDMDYQDIEYKLVNFLNENYYKDDKPITNRMLHSQQVMLITGLISKSKEISEEERKPLLCIISALVHDIGHVPGAHPTEEILGRLDGFFSHEINGRNVLEKIVTRDEEKITDTIIEYYQSIGKECNEQQIREYIQKNKTQIKKSIEAHSRTNSEKRGDGTVVQLPREADKICYCVSDIVDIMKRLSQGDSTVEFFPDEWSEAIVKKLGKGYEKEEIIRSKLEEMKKLINTNNFGELATNIANTISENVRDGKTYYDVDQDTWDILDGMIKYVKQLRTTGVIDNKRTQLQNAATYFIVKTFNEKLEQCGGNIENAWDKTIESVTNSNDLDILNCINELKEMLQNRPEEVKKAIAPGGILDTTVIGSLDNSNRQIKMQPHGKFQMTDLQPFLGKQYETPEAENIRDTYFNNNSGLSLCLREYLGTSVKALVIKRKRDKDGVTQVEREKYVSTDYNNGTLPELIAKFNLEHPDFDLQVPAGKPKCQIETIRNTAENENGVSIRKDKSKIITDSGEIDMPETIEIECNDRNVLKKVKQRLSDFLDMQGTSLPEVSTKETKEEQATRLIQEYEQSR